MKIANVLPRYTAMGNWKARILKKLNRSSRTKSGMSRSYVAVPPVTGWLGGDPRFNGLRG